MGEQPNSAIPMAIGFAVAVIIAYVIAWLLPKLDARSAGSGAAAGAILSLALIATTLAMNYAFEARPLSLWLINAGYMVVGVTLMGAIIGGWRKKA
jgi:hypothetical protein